MTDAERTAEILEEASQFLGLARLATKGPWGWGSQKPNTYDELMEGRFLYARRSVDYDGGEVEANGEFIEAAREFADYTLPALLKRLATPAPAVEPGQAEPAPFYWQDCTSDEYSAILAAFSRLKQSNKRPIEEAYKTILTRLKNQSAPPAAAPKWIATAERLPEFGQKVDFWQGEHKMIGPGNLPDTIEAKAYSGWFEQTACSFYPTWCHGPVKASFYNNSNGLHQLELITHWKPTVAPSQEKGTGHA